MPVDYRGPAKLAGKPDGGIRKLGLPCIVDRLIQQAVLQVLQERWGATFSEHSYGFRPRRSAHQAVAQAQDYIAKGYGYVVGVDLEKFFDRVNHDSLMARVASLDDLDKELARRGHRFSRYADDCNIYVRSRRAGERVMASVSRFLTRKLRLKVNEAKSAVARPEEHKFLGFSIANDGSERRIAPKALDKFKMQLRGMTSRTRKISLPQLIEELTPYLIGWRGYFGFCQTPRVLTNLEAWIRRRLRSYLWRQWRNGHNRFNELRRRGVPKFSAAVAAGSPTGFWRMSGDPAVQQALRNHSFDSLGFPRRHGWLQGPMHNLEDQRLSIRRTIETLSKVSGKVPVGWESPGLTETPDTADILAEEGIRYVADWVHDDMPCELKTVAGSLITLPYTVEINDVAVMAVAQHSSIELLERGRRQFDRLYKESASSPRIMSISVHPYLSGVPHRIGYLEEHWTTSPPIATSHFGPASRS